MASVEIIELRKLYGSVVALSNISLEIKSGSFFTLLGPSGCGKTTLLRTIAGFHAQNSGRIFIGEKAIEHTPAHKRDVGMVFQDYAVFPHLSVFDNVAFGLKQRRVSSGQIRERVASVLDIVQLGDYTNRMPHELSGGQQQRVGLARALVINPKVLLMDEPLSNLDAKLRVDLCHQIRRIQQDMGITTIYVTHDQEEALATSDMVCVMYNGIIQQAAPPLEIYNRPANRFVANFVGANNFLKVDTKGHGVVLANSGISTGISMPKGESEAGIVAAIRPEKTDVSQTAPHAGQVCLPAKLSHISFIGREMEIQGLGENGEEIRAVMRPDSDLMALSPGSDIHFNFSATEMSLFEDSETGRRLS
ncbi:MAG: ABC transporter ATP-binding protein [Cohaesibacteraceae bacterium]|nr:ABC transporter ATP-binding protein [Cohaesibacteraceae bacterium]MBL4875477.1 ABC transporter ATP-binding protein [Cohaesibacteraceae bacterium]